MGGIDLCFGRWDTPQHTLVDEFEGEQNLAWQGVTVILESQTFIPSTNPLKTCMIERRYPEFHGKWDKHICAEYIHELNCAGMTLACTSSGNQLGTFVGISSNGGIIFLGSRITRGQCLSSSHLQNISHKSSLRKV